MKIGYLGAGAWGFTLARLLAEKGHRVVSWTIDPGLAKKLNAGEEHPKMKGFKAFPGMLWTTDLEDVVQEADVVIESVTSAGLRPVCERLLEMNFADIPFVLTSKGIEQGSGKILSDVVLDVLGDRFRPLIGSLSGPSFADDVVRGLPTSVVASGYEESIIKTICELFCTERFRVYPNHDVRGVAYGGALKNVIAIACGLSDGLELGASARAAIITRGLHEIRKLAVSQGCLPETLNGLSGMGDLCLTCSSLTSRNFRFGYLLAQGMTPKEAGELIGMVVEGAYTCKSVMENHPKRADMMPITGAIFDILYKGLSPLGAVERLMKRTIKEESL